MIDRIYYRVQELASRWGCSVDDLIHLGVTGQAQICVNVYGLVAGMSRTRLDFSGRDYDAAFNDQQRQEATAHDALIEHWMCRTTEDMPDGVYELTHETLRLMEIADPFPHELDEGFKFDGGWWTCDFDPPVLVNMGHLCILHEEVTRLERDVFSVYGKNASTKGGSGESPVSPRERTTYLNIIGAMLELMKSPRPGRDSDAAVIAEIEDNYREKPGISARTLQDKFAAAKRSLSAS